MSGITLPWTYSGMQFASFCWHYEDVFLHSINYMHAGASKIWYCIPASDRLKFEQVCHEKLAMIYKKDKNFMLDINTMISPSYI